MPASPRNKKRGVQPPAPDHFLWKRQLEQMRLSSTTAAATAMAEVEKAEMAGLTEESNEYRPPENLAYYQPPVYGDSDSPENWKRRLEHGRLSAVSLEQSLIYPGPGAAGGGGDEEAQQQQALQVMMMAQAAAAEEEKKKQKMPLGDITKKLVKAQLIKKLKETFLSLCKNWIACWIFCPGTFFLFIHYNGELKKTASLYKEESKKRSGPLPGEDQKLKQYLKNLTIFLAVEWMNWAFLTAFWYGLLMLVLVLIYVIYKLIKCGLTVGISC